MEICSFIGPQEIILLLIIVVVTLIFPILALIDILKNEFEGNNKLIWILVVLLLWIIGAVLYYFIGRSQKIKK
jgi:Kef-type K+ transport system membrane component KefB